MSWIMGEAKVVAVALFLACLLAVCGAKGDQIPCRPSSCGDIRNISYPFRLQTDPSACGHPDYELACENNRTVVYLWNPRNYSSSWRYYVVDINYNRTTFRVVDPGVEKGKCFSTHLHSSILSMPGYPESPYYLNWKVATHIIVMMKCEQPMSTGTDGNYIPITPCNATNLTSSSSQPYVYALVGREYMVVGDINWSCTTGANFIIQNLSKPLGNLSASDLQEAMLLGLELTFPQNGKTWSTPGIFFYFEMAIFSISRVMAFIIAGRAVLGILCMFAYLIYKFQRRHLSLDDGIEEFLCNHRNLQPIKYSYSEIKKMTHNFKDKLGHGGFGSVYKGKLRSGRIVAVKMLIMSKSNGQDFINEVATIGRIHHVNVVRLVGFCIERSKWALVYDFMANGSLDKFVINDQGNNNPLSWETLYKIAIGVGRGINYLHQGCDMQILHFDIKPHNILLDKDFTPKVSDFGLAKLYSTDESIVSITAARGTLGYMAPELFYKNIGGVSFKADVYSFGMLLLEIVGKRKNVNAFAEHSSQIYFPTWIYDKYDQGEEMKLGDVTEDERKYIKKMVLVALWCIQMKPVDRPSMSKALEMLEGHVELLKMPPKPTLHPIEMPLENHDQVVAPISLSTSIDTISLDGR